MKKISQSNFILALQQSKEDNIQELFQAMYVSKAYVIEEIANIHNNLPIMILRPRQWGKSTLLNLFKVFYQYRVCESSQDQDKRKEFFNYYKSNQVITIFNIARIPDLFQQFLVLKMNLRTSNLKAFINEWIIELCTRFILSDSKNRQYYAKLINLLKQNKFLDVKQIMSSFMQSLYRFHKRKIVILIDNYDSIVFSEDFRAKSREQRRAQLELLERFLRSCEASSSNVIHRTIIFGVYSIFPNNLGFLSSSLYDGSPFLKTALGFTKSEVRQMIDNHFISVQGSRQYVEEIFQHISEHFGGYIVKAADKQIVLFHPKKTHIFLNAIVKTGSTFYNQWQQLIKVQYSFQQLGQIFKNVFEDSKTNQIRKGLKLLINIQDNDTDNINLVDLQQKRIDVVNRKNFINMIYQLFLQNGSFRQPNSFNHPNINESIIFSVILEKLKVLFQQNVQDKDNKKLSYLTEIMHEVLNIMNRQQDPQLRLQNFNESFFTNQFISSLRQLIPQLSYSTQLSYGKGRVDLLVRQYTTQGLIIILHQHKIVKRLSIITEKQTDILIEEALLQIFSKNYMRIAIQRQKMQEKWQKIILRGLVGIFDGQKIDMKYKQIALKPQEAQKIVNQSEMLFKDVLETDVVKVMISQMQRSNVQSMIEYFSLF